MRKQKKYHYIYKTTNPIGRYYIGAHSTDHLEDGYMGSGILIRRSIKSNSKENHRFEILEFCLDRQSLFEREAELVSVELMEDPLCMNLCKGGNGSWEHVNENPSAALTSARIKNCKNIPRHLKSIGGKRSGRTNFINAHKAGKIKYDTFRGMAHSEESKRKMSNSSKGTGLGNKNSQFGTCWVFKGIAKKIKKEELDLYLSEDWIRGRKPLRST